MITLNLLQLLENNGFGTIDKDLFWEKLTSVKKEYMSHLSATQLKEALAESSHLNSIQEASLTWQDVANCVTLWIFSIRPTQYVHFRRSLIKMTQPRFSRNKLTT